MSSSSENIKQAYLRVEKMLSLRLGQTPDLQAITFLIGLQELGQLKRLFSKEEKQDLMHLGVCRLLSQEGYYTFAGRDEDGWPHFEKPEKHQTGIIIRKHC